MNYPFEQRTRTAPAPVPVFTSDDDRVITVTPFLRP